MMRIEIEERANGERRALLNLGDGIAHSLRLEKAAELAVWIEELLPEEVARARQPKVPNRLVRTDEPR